MIWTIGLTFYCLIQGILGDPNPQEKLIGGINNWPAKVVAPYVYLPFNGDLTKIATKTGNKHYTLAFIVADDNGNPKWDSNLPINSFVNQVQKLREIGGDVIVAFGGASGTELSTVSYDLDDLVAKYQSIIDAYKLTAIDIDIEGDEIWDTRANKLRNEAMIILKENNPRLRIQYTVAIDIHGFPKEVKEVLKDAKKQGLDLDVVNIMTMDYGDGVTGLGEIASNNAFTSYQYLQKIGFKHTTIGVTPMIGKNDDDEIFSLKNARNLAAFATRYKWVTLLSYWSLGRDVNNQFGPLESSSQIVQKDYEFLSIFFSWKQPPVITPENKMTVVPDKIFAPYTDVLLWPTLDVSKVSADTGITWFTLAFVTADIKGTPAWGGAQPITFGSQNSFYMDQIRSLRSRGGDVIIAFGGATGTDLAVSVSRLPNMSETEKVKRLRWHFQRVIDTYKARWIDLDIEGPPLSDRASIDLRSKALALLCDANPFLRISYTLPAFPGGLTEEGLYTLRSAKANGLDLDVVNIMAMNYGASVAPDGANSMGKYAIEAAKSTVAQVQAEGFASVKNGVYTGTKIGVTPMIGKNDVAGETFTLENARELVEFASKQSWIRKVAHWSVNRDIGNTGALFNSNQITTVKYAFSNILKNWSTYSGSPNTQLPPNTGGSDTKPSPTTPSPVNVGKQSLSLKQKVFAPFTDILLWPTFDVNKVTNVPFFTLAFITSDAYNNPAWGGVVPTTQAFYLEYVRNLRKKGGDVIVSFGGQTGQELAMTNTNLNTLIQKYQSVIDLYSLKWVDFDIEGACIADNASNKRRFLAIAALKAANPGLIVSVTLPVMTYGLDPYGLAFVDLPEFAKAKIDVVNLMTMNYGPPIQDMGQAAIDAAINTHNQLKARFANPPLVGITPMLGENDIKGEVFTQAHMRKVVDFVKKDPRVCWVSYWSINRDTNINGPLYASSQIPQQLYEFASIGQTLYTSPVSKLVDVESESEPQSKFVTIPDRIFAPYTDVLLWPTLNINDANNALENQWYTLAFVTATDNGAPAWGGSQSIAFGSQDAFYLDKIKALRAKGGDVIISFGGAIGTELAVSVNNLPNLSLEQKVKRLKYHYQRVIDTYKIRWIDLDIEGSALSDSGSIELRSKALALLESVNPFLRISYTLPAFQGGLTDLGLNTLKSAKDHGVNLDVVNIMAMNYGAPDGANSMGRYAIQAAEATVAQLKSIGLAEVTPDGQYRGTKIGITPMIGNNDVAGEVFTIANSHELVDYAKKQPWIRVLSFWSMNRDNGDTGPLYMSNQITNEKYAFAKIFKDWASYSDSSSNSNSNSNSGNNGNNESPPPNNDNNRQGLSTKRKVLAPFVDVMLWPTFDINDVGIPFFTLAFVTSDTQGNPAWGSVVPTSDGFYLDKVQRLRERGGDVILSFGGATGVELAVRNYDLNTLVQKYQSVIDKYQLKWIDFDIEGANLPDSASNSRRYLAIAALKAANPGLIVSLTLPVTTSGLDQNGINLLYLPEYQQAKIDVINLMTMDYGPPIENMGAAAISAARGVHQQLVQVGGHVPLIGITPMIGENDVPGEVFSLQNARDVTEFARNDPTIAWIGYWSISRDTDQWGPLYASSQISQNKYDFARSFSGLASDYSVKLVDDHPSLKYPQPAEKYGIEVAKRLPEKVSVNKKPEEKKAEEKYYNFSKYADYHGKLAVRRGQEKIVYANQNSPPSRKVELNSNLFSPPLTTGRIFSPYVDVSLKPEFDTLDAHVRVSLSKFTFGFIIAGKKKVATWGGKIAIDSQHIIEEIAEVRKNHGDVIFSFGGLKGVELALAIKNIDELVNVYQSIITLHSITWIDFFINDSALEDVDSVQRRNEAIARLQKDNLNLKVSYSLHTFPTGLSQNGLNLLQSAVDAGAQIDVVNILAMNYGKTNAPNGGVAAGAYAIQAASSVSSQLDILKLNSSIGITPMIGQNHVTSEYFTLADAQQVISWAHTKDWVQFVSIFSANRDTKDLIIDANNGTAGGLNLQFCKVFSGFEH